ncbi:DNA polymerase III subunit gamma/tau [[Haemophilus] felis]|uniref:DNA polymerase III subunit gamma/tau n=1 Tax=[Haemophilus] felis TaxID=123822 RepID=A0A1T0AW52_9PAST|nr:DNA polymerase III subunit gamma/tau [[Haemophilus] felis]OOS01028.1 DNA polymerase III subunit gamma/tau [[Haemophilus] felis]
MSYQVLARKWRPKTFSEVVGQQHILTAIANGLRENRLHHAYLFSGTRGVGKTSIARLFAKGLNCINGVTAEPCGHCEHCRAIEQGNFIDLIEIDAASRTKVEDTRELLDNVQYKPVQGRYKVYLIDEVHMLSRHSFNALLKTLEEPPEYVKFLLATTDPQKLPVTILSRCMQFHLKALEPQQIAQHLAFILQQEKIPFETLALDKLAKAAQGSIRDSLSLTDQAIALSNANLTLSSVNQMLGLLDDNQAIDILYALQEGNGEKLMQYLDSVAARGADWDELLREIAEQLHQIAMYQWLSNASVSENKHIQFLSKHFAPDEVQFFYQVILSGRKELAFAPNRRMGVEMTLLRALAFSPKIVNYAPTAIVQSMPQPQNAPPEVNKKGDEAKPQTSISNKNQLNPQTAVNELTEQVSRSEPMDVNNDERNQVSSGTQTSIHSNALDAITQLNVLDQKRANLQKKKPDLTSSSANSNPSSRLASASAEQGKQPQHKVDTLPVVDVPTSSNQTMMLTAAPLETELEETYRESDFVEMDAMLMDSMLIDSMSMTGGLGENIDPYISSLAEQDQEDQELAQKRLAETYRWQWTNPELAKMPEKPTPSSLKATLQKGMSKDLQVKIIDLARQQDKWVDIVESLDIAGMTKELALNCCLVAQNESEIQLVISRAQQHLNNKARLQRLEQALQAFFNQGLILTLAENDEIGLTPNQWYEQIYQQLKEQAKTDLQQDKGLQRLLHIFRAELDLENVAPL